MGCTHYRYLAKVIKQILPASVQFIDPAEHVVKAAEQELELLGIRNNLAPLPTRFYVSGSPSKFAKLSSQWLGCIPKVEQVCLPAIHLT